MAIQLTSAIQSQIDNQRIIKAHTFTLNSVDYSAYVRNFTFSYDKKFGSATMNVVLDNVDSAFGMGGANQINVGDIVQLIESYEGDATQFKKFYGKVEQRTLSQSMGDSTITLVCLDYISILRKLDIDMIVEGDKVEITNETLKPNFLSSPNQMFAQVFDFANNAIAEYPPPILYFTNKSTEETEQQNDGFDTYYDVGQVKLGSPLNALDNYDFIARNYWFYTNGLHIEDIIEDLLTQPDGYGKYLFGETTAQAVIDNHLTTSFQDEEGAGKLDYLIGNATTSTIEIRHTVTEAITAGETAITLDSVDGLPTSGTGTIAGDTFTWTGISSLTLTGIDPTGGNALLAHPINSIMKYEADYPSGQVWYLTYSNVSSTLTNSNFTVPGATVSYFDSRQGRIILNTDISLAATVRCNYNYEFKTLQATGVELNRISFRPREVANRFEALQKLREYLAPNYIIFTQGDDKVWSNYLSQKATADYTLDLIRDLNYLEDEDLYTRVVFYRKNKNPNNLMFNTSVDFVTTGQTYKGDADSNELAYEKTEEGWHYYKTTISDAGYITGDEQTPIIYINGIPVDNRLRQMVALPITIDQKTRTETDTTSSKKGSSTETRSYYYYKIIFPHQNIEPTQDIIVYNQNGASVLTISAGDANMNYGTGTYVVPGTAQNSTMETVSTATYWVRYSTDFIEIDYVNIRFKINQKLLPNPEIAIIKADYQYYTVFTAQSGTGAVIDGRWDTQVQTEFFSQPPTGYNYAIVDLGAVRTIQAMDIVAGFYKPDDVRKFDIGMRITLHYSEDNVSYFEISSETHSIEFNAGESASFEEDELGVDFQARYIKVILEDVKKVDYKDGVYPVAFTEFSCYDNIILKSEATLIPTALLTQTMSPSDTTVYVDDTSYFTDPASGETESAYVNGTAFTYTGLTSTSFVGTTVTDSGAVDDKVYQSEATTTTVYDDDQLLPKLGDRLFKDTSVDAEKLYTQAQLDDLAKDYLQEFYKEHTKLATSVVYAPYLRMGQTVSLTDSNNNISGVNYFIEKIEAVGGVYNLTLARYPV